MAMTDVLDWMRSNPGAYTMYEISSAMRDGGMHPSVTSVRVDLERLIRRGVVARAGDVRGPYGNLRALYTLAEETA